MVLGLKLTKLLTIMTAEIAEFKFSHKITVEDDIFNVQDIIPIWKEGEKFA